MDDFDYWDIWAEAEDELRHPKKSGWYTVAIKEIPNGVYSLYNYQRGYYNEGEWFNKKGQEFDYVYWYSTKSIKKTIEEENKKFEIELSQFTES